MDGSPIQGLILFVVFTIFNFIMYSFGEACQNVNDSDLKDRADEGDRRAGKLLDIIHKPKKFVVTIQLTATAFAMVIGFFQVKLYGEMLTRWAVKKLSYDGSDILPICIYLLTALMLVIILLSVGIIVPQRLGKRQPEKWALKFVGFISVIMTVLRPLTIIVSGFAGIILKLFGVDYNDDTDNVTEEEIMSIVNEGHEQGILEEQEAEMISNIIEMDEKEAAKIMTHRKNIVAVDGDWTLAETVEFIINESNSRFPVFESDIDNIIGIIHFRDVFSSYKKGDMNHRPVKELTEILREPVFIPETRNIDMVFRDMQREKNHMDIIVDEYGQTAGIITMEDILEEIVGNIMDEYDEDENNIIQESEDTYVIKGITPLSDIEDEIDIAFDEEDYDTLNGYLINKLDRIPSEDDNIILETAEGRFEVLSIEGKMISLVRMTVLKKESEEQAAEED